MHVLKFFSRVVILSVVVGCAMAVLYFKLMDILADSTLMPSGSLLVVCALLASALSVFLFFNWVFWAFDCWLWSISYPHHTKKPPDE